MKEKEQKPKIALDPENEPETERDGKKRDVHYTWDMNQAGEEFSKIWKKARESMGDLGHRIREGARASRHRVEASLLERERKQLLESIGLQVYERMKEAGTEGFPSGIINLCTRIAQLDTMIERERETAKEHWEEVKRGNERENENFFGEEEREENKNEGE